MITSIIMTYAITTTNGTANIPYIDGRCICVKHNPKYECEIATLIENGEALRTVRTTYNDRLVKDEVILECGESL